jgi:alpha,alpha-trehalase
MKNLILIGLLLLALPCAAQNNNWPPTPDVVYGQLFADVQMQKILADGKTFVDCTPKRKVKDILYDYGMMKGANFDLKKFVADNFDLPVTTTVNVTAGKEHAATHIKQLWALLKRDADVSARWEGGDANGKSLLALPYPYIVPGGRFREIYYWDSYFTMLGLKESGRADMIENMVKNFDYLIYNFGHIPNGNRTYYLSRSQPPFFCMMVELLAGIKGTAVYKKYLPAMLKEYAYWMAGADKLAPGEATKYVVRLKDGKLMNRYWDDLALPRQESHKEDVEAAEEAAQELAALIKVASEAQLKKSLDDKRAAVYTHLRAGACSGWDFSSRWFAVPQKIATIQTTDIIPVDLNCLMYNMETIIARALRLAGRHTQANSYTQKADARKAAIQKYCWQEDKGYYFDYNFTQQTNAEVISAAGVYPLYVKIASAAQAKAAAATVKKYLLKDGGIVSTTNNNGQQWDAPNGWAPQQWVAVTAFANYKQNDLAKTIARRWLALNDKVYAATGKMMEKYNVEDLQKEAGGGEYPGQDGFGWTNGVYIALLKLYGK